MSYTLAEVSEKTGKSQVALRKMIERGQLVAEKEGGRTVISEEALDAMTGSQVLDEAATAVRTGRTGEVGNIFSRLPSSVANAILSGMPTTKKPTGDPELVRKAVSRVPKYPKIDVPSEEQDPHRGFPVGHRHVDGPRWKRTAKNVWSLGDATYTWNGFLWEGGGSRSDMTLPHGISPADPDTHYRPLAPSPSHAK